MKFRPNFLLSPGSVKAIAFEGRGINFFLHSFCPDFDSPVTWHPCFINCWQLKMQPWTLSKLLLIISFLDISSSVEYQGHSAGHRRPEPFVALSYATVGLSNQIFSCNGCAPGPYFFHNWGADFSTSRGWRLLAAYCSYLSPFATSFRQRELLNTITWWLGRDTRHTIFDSLTQHWLCKKWPTI